jgi:5-methyltetrahydrofolate--homocysteine methyltransferase
MDSALATLEGSEKIMKGFPGINTICSLTNVSNELPEREPINRTFLLSAITRGLDSVILDPTDKPLFSSPKAALTVNGKVEFCIYYLTAFREGQLG